MGRASEAAASLLDDEPAAGPAGSAERHTVLLLVDKFDYHGSALNGPSRYFSWLAEHLDRKRFRPVVCALREKGASDVLFRERGIDVRYLEMGRFDPRTLLRLTRLIREEGVDLLHLTGYGAMGFGRIASLMTGVPAILHEHWVDPDLHPLHALAERILSLLPARAIAISEYAAEFLQEKKGISDADIALIRNGIPVSEFRSPPAGAGVEKRREFGIDADAPVVGVVGMFHYNKGHRYFLEAAALLKDSHPDVVFTIVGDGELRSELERYRDELGLGDRVRFLGQQRDMPGILDMMDIWVMSSNSETAPLSLLEAMAAGKPIVTTDCGGPGEIVRHGETGLVCPTRDPGSLASAVARLVDDGEEAARFGANAQRESEKYSLVEMLRKLESFYLETLRTGRRQTPGVAAGA